MSTEIPRYFGLLRVAFDQALAAVLAEVGPRHPALRPAHVQLFRFGGIDGSHTAELAAHAGMTKQSMHELVTHLERHGYLVRQPDPTDTRARRLRLTTAGRRLERQLHDAIADVLDNWERDLGRDRFDQLWAILQQLTGETTPLPDRTLIRVDPVV
ncbi:MarR family winged helix-turn-helix transcriptional regulator [Streptomyces sp. SID13031]|uniref:MarR family winged helix-turn-helix transcriptional regulator n=1 Tax=Streptomyces sp. SID13031 TaxID=2706046 RepID=UPI0013CACCD2|nr:MarR family winged helix-turn-helix transcriptional regulator [Streptomyces sp. SID13031]NEA31361.1 winged helix-turn-helix transcriptional regulator [Streptomyces sp. SID13031]